MKLNTIYNGDAKEILSQLHGECINTVVTSPPYYGLRDYGVDGQIGLEETPDKYIDNLVCVFREVKRVLRNDGTLWLNIGDSYAGSNKGGATHPESAENYFQGTNKGLVGKTAVTKVTWGDCKPKDLIGIPWMLAFALRNDGWYLRQDIIWHKPNPMPESVKDRCTKSHEYIFLLSKSRKYYYNADAIKEPTAYPTGSRPDKKRGDFKGKYHAHEEFKHISDSFRAIRDYRNKRDVWTVTTKPYRGAHFATFPPDLIEPCVLAGCPENGVVMDPFFGAGTVGVVCKQLNRNYIGIDLNNEYCDLAKQRIG